MVSAIQTLELVPLNGPPVADAGGPYAIGEGSSVTLNAGGSTDPDLPNDVLSYVWDLDGDGVFGELGVDAERGNEIGISPVLQTDGVDGPVELTVALWVIDSFGELSSDSAMINVFNLDPVAGSDVFGVGEDNGPILIDVLSNDSDPADDLDPISIVSVDADGLIGTVQLNGGAVSYSPNGQFENLGQGQSFEESFTYTISDGDGGEATGTVTITIEGANDAPTATLEGSAGDELDGQDQQFAWSVSDVDGNLTSVEIEVTKDGERIDSVSGPVDESGSIDLNDQGVGLFELVFTATDSAESIVTASRSVSVSDDDTVAPQVSLSGSSGTELEIDTNEYSWSVEDGSGLSALSVTVTRDTGEGPAVIFATTDTADATGSFNFDDYGVGIYEVLVVATDADGDWAGDAASSHAGRTSVVGELFVSTSTRAKLEVEDGEWVTLHRSDVTSTHDGDVLFDHSQLSHPWFSWWKPNLNAFHMLADGSMILSTDGRGKVGDQDFRDGGLVRFFGDEWLARNADNPGQLHQTAQMVTTEEQLFGNRSWLTGVDAISIAPDGNLVISLDRNRSLADGKSYHRGDLIKIVLQDDGTLASSELHFDHQVLDATGWRLFGRWFDQGVNVDGAHVLEDGRIVLSVSSTATAGDGGESFQDGDVFVYDPDTDLAELLFDEDSFRRNEDVDAVFLGIGNGELDLLDSPT